MSNLARRKIPQVVIPAVFWLGVWQLAAFLIGRELLLPSPVAVAARLLALAGGGPFWLSVAGSLCRVFLGFLGGCVLGGLLAGLTACSRWADMVLSPAVRVMRAVPVASFILLLQLWIFTGGVPAVCAALMVMPVVWGNVRKGLDETDPLLLEAANAYRFGRWKTVKLVYLPSALPYFASSSLTGMGLAWKAGVAAEVLALPKGAIGLELRDAKLYLETADLFAWTVVVIVLSFALESALAALFRRWERGRQR